MTKWQYPLVPRFYNLVDEDDSFSRLIIINSINTASTHEQSATGICYLQNSRTLPHWIASRTDYQSVTTNLCRAGTSSSLWYLWGTSEYSAETETENQGVTYLPSTSSSGICASSERTQHWDISSDQVANTTNPRPWYMAVFVSTQSPNSHPSTIFIHASPTHWSIYAHHSQLGATSRALLYISIIKPQLS